MGKMSEILSNSMIFKNIGEPEVRRIISEVEHGTENFSKGGIIRSKGEKVTDLPVLISGKVRTEMINVDGDVLQVSEMRSPDVIALGFLFASDNRYPVDVVAEEDVRLFVLPKDSVLKACSMNRDFLLNLLGCMGEKLHSLSSKIEVLSMKNIRQKIAYYFLQLDSGSENEIVLQMNREKLANLFGVARPSLSRVLSELERERVISCDRKKVRILDRTRLRSIAAGEG